MSSSEAAAVNWRRSALCQANGTCVELAGLAGGKVAVRDTEDRSGPVIVFGPAEWRGFTEETRAGKFDL